MGFGPGDDGLVGGDVGDVGFSAYSLLMAFASEYLTTALGQPFEVGKTLLQVEWTPREDVAPPEPEVFSESSSDAESDGEEQPAGGSRQNRADGRRRPRARPSAPQSQQPIENPEDAEAYFSDVISGASGSRPFVPTAEVAEDAEEALETDRDAEGYLPDIPQSYRIRTDVSPSGSKGVWGMMRRVRRTPSEGLPGLWKGQLLGTAHSLLTTNLQPIVHDLLLLAIPVSGNAAGNLRLNASLDLPLASHPNPAIPLGLHVAAHLVTHLFLSPLELLRTRTIVQPSAAPSTTSSPRMLQDVVKNEGGIGGLFFHPQLLLPAVLEHTLRPLFTLSIPLFIERQLHVTPDSSPIAYSVLDLGLGLASLLVILPIETVRKRLQLQERRPTATLADSARPSIVRLREQPYVGIVEAIYRIITEETGARKRRRRRSSNRRPSMLRRRSSMGQGQPMENRRSMFDGVRQLYRGVSLSWPWTVRHGADDILMAISALDSLAWPLALTSQCLRSVWSRRDLEEAGQRWVGRSSERSRRRCNVCTMAVTTIHLNVLMLCRRRHREADDRSRVR